MKCMKRTTLDIINRQTCLVTPCPFEQSPFREVYVSHTAMYCLHQSQFRVLAASSASRVCNSCLLASLSVSFLVCFLCAESCDCSFPPGLLDDAARAYAKVPRSANCPSSPE